LTHHSNKKKLWRLPKIPGSILKYRVPPLCERRTTFAKAYGMKVTCYREHVGGTHWELGEHIGNTLEPRKNEKKSFPHPKKT
jgi:hypothetical protein